MCPSVPDSPAGYRAKKKTGLGQRDEMTMSDDCLRKRCNCQGHQGLRAFNKISRKNMARSWKTIRNQYSRSWWRGPLCPALRMHDAFGLQLGAEAATYCGSSKTRMRQKPPGAKPWCGPAPSADRLLRDALARP